MKIRSKMINSKKLKSNKPKTKTGKTSKNKNQNRYNKPTAKNLISINIKNDWFIIFILWWTSLTSFPVYSNTTRQLDSWIYKLLQSGQQNKDLWSCPTTIEAEYPPFSKSIDQAKLSRSINSWMKKHITKEYHTYLVVW